MLTLAVSRMRRHPNIGRYILGTKACVLHHRTDAGVVGRLGNVVHNYRATVTTEHVVRAVGIVQMRVCANQRGVVHQAGRLGQVLADVQAWNARGDRLEFTTNLGRSVRLHVEHINVTWAADQVNHDDRLGRTLTSCRGSVTGLDHVWQTKSQG